MNRQRYIQEHTHALDGVLRDISPRPPQWTFRHPALALRSHGRLIRVQVRLVERMLRAQATGASNRLRTAQAWLALIDREWTIRSLAWVQAGKPADLGQGVPEVAQDQVEGFGEVFHRGGSAGVGE